MPFPRRKTADLHQQQTPKKRGKHRTPSKPEHIKPHICYEPVGLSEFSTGQWNLHGQRLYPTMSDSAVCGYPFSSADYYPTTLPMCPLLSPNVYSTPTGILRKRTRVKKKNKVSEEKLLSNNNSNYTSLPPVNSEDVYYSQKRRFSDPGLNNVEESSNESSTSNEESISDSDCSFIPNETLMEQITELRTANKSLCCELETTKNELKILKSELALVTSKVTCHEPFSLTRKQSIWPFYSFFGIHFELHSRDGLLVEMVKEIRDAAEAREKIMLSKIETSIEQCLNSKNVVSI